MPERSPMTTVGDTVTVQIPRSYNGTVTGILSGGVSPVGAVAALELSADDGITWEVATLTRPDRTTVTTLAQGQSGWCEAPTYDSARLRLTAITSGSIGGRINVRDG